MSNGTFYTIIVSVVISIAAWVTHIVHCLMYAKYMLLIAGGIVAPIGVIHGIGIWFGASWQFLKSSSEGFEKSFMMAKIKRMEYGKLNYLRMYSLRVIHSDTKRENARGYEAS